MSEKMFNFEFNEAKNAIIITLQQSYDLARDGQSTLEEGTALLESLSAPAYYVIDSVAWERNFGDLLAATQMGTAGPNPYFQHKNIKEIILVDPRPVSKGVAEGWTTDVFGSLPVTTADNIEDAFKHIDEN